MITRISTIFFAFALVIFMTASAATADDIRNSRHNLSVTGGWNITTGTGGFGYSSVLNDLTNADAAGETTRICVFCHTPHAANMDSPVPLWNKRFQEGPNGYIRRGDNVAGPDDFASAGGVSLACLQCHDGTQALDVMINAPGSGNWDTAGARAGYGFLEFSIYDSSDGGTGDEEVSYIGTDLTNDHPVMLAFAEGDCAVEGGTGTCSGDHASDFNMPTYANDKFSFANGIVLGMRDAGDFFDSVAMRAGETFGTVECYSCHNPHLGNWDSSNNVGSFSTDTSATQMFLRVKDNAGSGICLTCHVK